MSKTFNNVILQGRVDDGWSNDDEKQGLVRENEVD